MTGDVVAVNNRYQDARIIIEMVRNHFQKLNPQLGYLFFRVDLIKRKNNDKWVVICSFLEGFGSPNRIYHELEVLTKDGSFENLKIITKEQAETKINEVQTNNSSA